MLVANIQLNYSNIFLQRLVCRSTNDAIYKVNNADRVLQYVQKPQLMHSAFGKFRGINNLTYIYIVNLCHTDPP